MTNNLSRVDVLENVGEHLRAQYGVAPIPLKRIVAEALRVSEYAASSIMPSDFCYNYLNKDPTSMADPMFEKVKRGMYMFLGRKYPYSGPVYWAPKGQPRRVVGEWTNGVCKRHDSKP